MNNSHYEKLFEVVENHSPPVLSVIAKESLDDPEAERRSKALKRLGVTERAYKRANVLFKLRQTVITQDDFDANFSASATSDDSDLPNHSPSAGSSPIIISSSSAPSSIFHSWPNQKQKTNSDLFSNSSVKSSYGMLSGADISPIPGAMQHGHHDQEEDEPIQSTMNSSEAVSITSTRRVSAHAKVLGLSDAQMEEQISRKLAAL